MPGVTLSMCLKMNRDTFVYPQQNGGVYLRNNKTSIQMEGNTIEQWLQNLIPMLDGSRSIEEITDGLPDPYKEQVYKIAEVLYTNGFVRDTSQDLPHQLSAEVLEKHASQIEFIDHLSHSGAHRFQKYRESKIALIGCGPLLSSLTASLLQSGLPAFTIFHTNTKQNETKKLQELMKSAKKTEPESSITLLSFDENCCTEDLANIEYVLYANEGENTDQLSMIQKVCRDQSKSFLPVTLQNNQAFVGPLQLTDSAACWKTASLRLGKKDNKETKLKSSRTASNLLANVAVFMLFKVITGVQENPENAFYQLNVETLEGNWHPVFPHPLVTNNIKIEVIEDPFLFIKEATTREFDLHSLFYQITSSDTGIFQQFEEGDLSQLPLSQCKVHVADPFGENEPEVITAAGRTHEDARLEAGLSGIETYAKTLFMNSPEVMSVGTGRSATEGMYRALQNRLQEIFMKSHNKLHVSAEVDRSSIQDAYSTFLIGALTPLGEEIKFFLGKKIHGFPVIWVQQDRHCFGSIGLDEKRALQNALQGALMYWQNKEEVPNKNCIKSSTTISTTGLQTITLSESKEVTLTSALQTLKNNNCKATFYTLHAETILNENTSGLFGITLSSEVQS
ncbi:bacteriocin maturation protein [Fictibacillus phosphorivorans]|uniref:bacteriocin maturation protein n=1 Tax=Fictibacillus phosphorivorans TaxID=1221500 RepID=UPI001292FF1F|nr:bacteriocin maturation protein [Fictibacillus phosphorivorans]MQR94493.1 bacteriocin maturation protein [Fictibacillus phosphorivorans]